MGMGMGMKIPPSFVSKVKLTQVSDASPRTEKRGRLIRECYANPDP